MEELVIDNNRKLFCITASSFPEGVKAAFDTLQKYTGNKEYLDLYGISYKDERGNIIYKAAARETFDGEGAQKGCATFILKKGRYLSHTIKDWERNMDKFQPAFTELRQHPDLDRNGCCVELYKGVDEVICMVRLKDKRGDKGADS